MEFPKQGAIDTLPQPPDSAASPWRKSDFNRRIFGRISKKPAEE
jgi:hypothetical protein